MKLTPSPRIAEWAEFEDLPQAFGRPVEIFSDFDGTIVQQDSLKFLLQKYGGKHWDFIRHQMESGLITEREALQRAFQKMEISLAQAYQILLTHIEIDPGFSSFYDWVQSRGFSLSILSGGFQSFIQKILKEKYGFKGIRVIANEVSEVNGKWTVKNASQNPLCSYCSHCKSASLLEKQIRPNVAIPYVVYIGDGFTDACPVQIADLVCAKNHLIDLCDKNKVPYKTYNSFFDVQEILEGELGMLSTDSDQLQPRKFPLIHKLLDADVRIYGLKRKLALHSLQSGEPVRPQTIAG